MKRGEILNELESMREQAFFLREQGPSLSDSADRLERGIQDLVNRLGEPSQVEYDKSKLDEPPRVRRARGLQERHGEERQAVGGVLLRQTPGRSYELQF